MTQNILTALDGWFDALPGAGSDLAKPGTGVVDAPTKAAANDSPPAQPDTTSHDLQDNLQWQVRTEKTASMVAVTSPVTTDSAVSGPTVASLVATENATAQRQPSRLAPAPDGTPSWRPLKSLPDGNWKDKADTYYRHGLACAVCIAAGRNPDLSRCSIGAPLWVAYQRAVALMKRNAS